MSSDAGKRCSLRDPVVHAGELVCGSVQIERQRIRPARAKAKRLGGDGEHQPGECAARSTQDRIYPAGTGSGVRAGAPPPLGIWYGTRPGC